MVLALSWQGTPDEIERATLAYLRRVDSRLDAAIGLITDLLQREARLNAPWTDRTGAAREGLSAAALSSLAAQDIVRIYLFHTVPYGIFLELSRGGKYAVIMPTIERLAPTIQSILQGVLQ